MTDEKTYSVGYKRPPQHTRFKAGQSGNPKGKAIGTLNLQERPRARVFRAYPDPGR